MNERLQQPSPEQAFNSIEKRYGFLEKAIAKNNVVDIVGLYRELRQAIFALGTFSSDLEPQQTQRISEIETKLNNLEPQIESLQDQVTFANVFDEEIQETADNKDVRKQYKDIMRFYGWFVNAQGRNPEGAKGYKQKALELINNFPQENLQEALSREEYFDYLKAVFDLKGGQVAPLVTPDAGVEEEVLPPEAAPVAENLADKWKPVAQAVNKKRQEILKLVREKDFVVARKTYEEAIQLLDDFSGELVTAGQYDANIAAQYGFARKNLEMLESKIEMDKEPHLADHEKKNLDDLISDIRSQMSQSNFDFGRYQEVDTALAAAKQALKLARADSSPQISVVVADALSSSIREAMTLREEMIKKGLQAAENYPAVKALRQALDRANSFVIDDSTTVDEIKIHLDLLTTAIPNLQAAYLDRAAPELKQPFEELKIEAIAKQQELQAAKEAVQKYKEWLAKIGVFKKAVLEVVRFNGQVRSEFKQKVNDGTYSTTVLKTKLEALEDAKLVFDNINNAVQYTADERIQREIPQWENRYQKAKEYLSQTRVENLGQRFRELPEVSSLISSIDEVVNQAGDRLPSVQDLFDARDKQALVDKKTAIQAAEVTVIGKGYFPAVGENLSDINFSDPAYYEAAKSIRSRMFAAYKELDRLVYSLDYHEYRRKQHVKEVQEVAQKIVGISDDDLVKTRYSADGRNLKLITMFGDGKRVDRQDLYDLRKELNTHYYALENNNLIVDAATAGYPDNEYIDAEIRKIKEAHRAALDRIKECLENIRLLQEGAREQIEKLWIQVLEAEEATKGSGTGIFTKDRKVAVEDLAEFVGPKYGREMKLKFKIWDCYIRGAVGGFSKELSWGNIETGRKAVIGEIDIGEIREFLAFPGMKETMKEIGQIFFNGPFSFAQLAGKTHPKTGRPINGSLSWDFTRRGNPEDAEIEQGFLKFGDVLALLRPELTTSTRTALEFLITILELRPKAFVPYFAGYIESPKGLFKMDGIAQLAPMAALMYKVRSQILILEDLREISKVQALPKNERMRLERFRRREIQDGKRSDGGECFVLGKLVEIPQGSAAAVGDTIAGENGNYVRGDLNVLHYFQAVDYMRATETTANLPMVGVPEDFTTIPFIWDIVMDNSFTSYKTISYEEYVSGVGAWMGLRELVNNPEKEFKIQTSLDAIEAMSKISSTFSPIKGLDRALSGNPAYAHTFRETVKRLFLSYTRYVVMRYFELEEGDNNKAKLNKFRKLVEATLRRPESLPDWISKYIQEALIDASQWFVGDRLAIQHRKYLLGERRSLVKVSQTITPALLRRLGLRDVDEVDRPTTLMVPLPRAAAVRANPTILALLRKPSAKEKKLEEE